MEILRDLIFDYTLRNVALGSALLGLVSGVLGCFAVLRKQGLMGDALAHAALPGVCVAFLLTGSKAPLVLALGAAVAGWLGVWLLLRITSTSRISQDSALGLVLSVFFGGGLVLLTFINKRSDGNQAGLDHFLFGQAATLIAENVITMAVLGVLALIVTVLFYKEFKLLSFDSGFAGSIGLPLNALNIGLTGLTVVAVVIGLQTVGVVLMAAMLVGPAVAARQWTHKLASMLVIAGGIGALSGVVGAMLSARDSGVPTGPMIILSLTAMVLGSLFFAPERGLVWEWVRRRRTKLMEPAG